MNKSNETNELFAAMAKAQGEIKTAELDATNPHFRSKYATLTSVRNACREALAKHNLAVIQTVESENDGYVVTTMLTHSTGQWVSSTLRLLVSQQTMQGLGSAITYAKRYSLAAIVGVVDEGDDDGVTEIPAKPPVSNAVRNMGQAPRQPSPSTITREAPPPQQAPVLDPQAARNEAPVGAGHVRALTGLMKQRNISPPVMTKFLNDVYKIESSANMRCWQADEISALLQDESTSEGTLMARCAAMPKKQDGFAPGMDA